MSHGSSATAELVVMVIVSLLSAAAREKRVNVREKMTEERMARYVVVSGRLGVDLIKLVSNVRPSVRPSVCPKCCFDFNEIWYVGRGRRVMHDGMQYDPIQGQGHKLFKVGNPSVFKSYLLCHLQWELATDH